MLEAKKNVGTVVVMIMDRCGYWDAKVEKGNISNQRAILCSLSMIVVINLKHSFFNVHI